MSAGCLRTFTPPLASTRRAGKVEPRSPVCVTAHPDAIRRAQERQKRQLDTQRLIEAEKRGRWWDVPSPKNVWHVYNAADFGASVASANRTGRLVVVQYFRPDCAGCKAMWPKTLQIMSQHPDVTFIKVNTGDDMMRMHCERMGLSRLPFFQFYISGRLVAQFTCNLTTISRLREAIATHRIPEHRDLSPHVCPWRPTQCGARCEVDLRTPRSPRITVLDGDGSAGGIAAPL